MVYVYVVSSDIYDENREKHDYDVYTGSAPLEE
jgi:hypothetical protein